MVTITIVETAAHNHGVTPWLNTPISLVSLKPNQHTETIAYLGRDNKTHLMTLTFDIEDTKIHGIISFKGEQPIQLPPQKLEPIGDGYSRCSWNNIIVHGSGLNKVTATVGETNGML